MSFVKRIPRVRCCVCKEIVSNVLLGMLFIMHHHLPVTRGYAHKSDVW